MYDKTFSRIFFSPRRLPRCDKTAINKTWEIRIRCYQRKRTVFTTCTGKMSDGEKGVYTNNIVVAFGVCDSPDNDTTSFCPISVRFVLGLQREKFNRIMPGRRKREGETSKNTTGDFFMYSFFFISILTQRVCRNGTRNP